MMSVYMSTKISKTAKLIFPQYPIKFFMFSNSEARDKNIKLLFIRQCFNENRNQTDGGKRLF